MNYEIWFSKLKSFSTVNTIVKEDLFAMKTTMDCLPNVPYTQEVFCKVLLVWAKLQATEEVASDLGKTLKQFFCRHVCM